MEAIIGMQLRVGVVLAATVVVIGGALGLRNAAGTSRPDYHVFHGTAQALRNPASILAGALHGDGASVIQFGLLLLIATPILRVVFALVGFLIERDWLYSVVSLLVLAILIYSLVRVG